jgi:hypothetical protein
VPGTLVGVYRPVIQRVLLWVRRVEKKKIYAWETCGKRPLAVDLGVDGRMVLLHGNNMGWRGLG